MEHFDVAIIGGGLAGLMVADHLAESPNSELRVAIIDPRIDSLGQKTFSSWQKRSDPPHRYSHLVTGRWDHFRVTSSQGVKIERDFGDYSYERIPGDLLDLHLSHRLDQDPRFHRILASALEVRETHSPDSRTPQVKILLSNGGDLTASKVLSSPANHPGAVLQYFLGFEIETPSDHFDPSRVDLMDFRVGQAGDVRFVYLLPFSKRSALVEFTVFSPEKMSQSQCEAHLKNYLSTTLGIESYEIKKTESGTIPMGVEVQPVFAPSFLSSMIQGIGSAASRIKPSTGYSFKSNLEALKNPKSTGYSGFRFRVYDSLLLARIRAREGSVSESLTRLFERNSPAAVFSFLDQRSSLRQELKILSSLPAIPFLVQLIALYPFAIASALTLVLHLWVGGSSVWLVPLLGLVTVGMGHGSLDPWLRPTGMSQTSFYLRYLGMIGLFLGVWLIHPLIALAFFIFQSADHLGESYWLRSLLTSKNDLRVRLFSSIWGLFASLFSVFFHWDQSVRILTPILRLPTALDGQASPLLEELSLGDARILALCLWVLALSSAWILDRYDQRATGRAPSGVPATLLLGASFCALPLLPGFLCFFSFWHGWDSALSTRLQQGWSAP